MRGRGFPAIERSERLERLLIGIAIALGALVLLCWLAGPVVGSTCERIPG